MTSLFRLFKRIRLIGFGAIALVTLGLIVACSGGGGGTATGSTLEKVQSAGVMKVGYANEAPYAYQDDSGNLTGEAPEIARAVLEDMGITEIEGVLTEFGSLIPGLQAGRFDMIAAGMYIRPERCEQIAFSDPTYGIGEGFIVKPGNPMGLASYQDVLDNPDATLGVVAGAVEQGYAEAVGIPANQVEIFPDAPSAVEAVKAGRIDAYGGTSLTVQDMVDKSQGSVERAKDFEDPVIDGESVKGYGAFGFRKEDEELRNTFNEALTSYIGTPEHLETVRPFGFTEADLPGDATAASLCSA
ncbi:ectoine/hydroxyectoine ABC transporter substrate-binding protein EhuB [filamentous cyanobacterium CCP5]|nr:ectoine/hydroxyectoine ABC transporter substrate-binding protein EhuB [filamentous cyanobacterium CCP5]